MDSQPAEVSAIPMCYNQMLNEILSLAIQTLGEEYTDVWQYSAFNDRVPSVSLRAALILLPTLPSYVLARWGSGLSNLEPRVARLLRALPTALEVIAEINLAIFYLKGTYYDVSKRLLGIRHVCDFLSHPLMRC